MPRFCRLLVGFLSSSGCHMMSDIFLNGGAVMTPPTTGAIFQLVDPAGTIIHEYAARPVGTVRRIERVVF
ncbi:MAG: hypothetical protein WBL68_00635 [Nitrososphaeraceae archaeon]